MNRPLSLVGQWLVKLSGLALGLLWPALVWAGGLPAVVPLDVALDTPGRVWTTGAVDPWFGQNFDTHDGVDVARSGGDALGGGSWLETTITGPARVQGWAKKDGEYRAYGGYLEIRLNGSEVWTPATLEWESFELQIPRGTHQLRCVYVPGIPGESAALDQIVVTPITETSLSAAIDYGSSETVWRAPGSVARGCLDAAAEGAVGEDYVCVRAAAPGGGRPAFETNLAGPARIHFRWRVLGSGDLVVNGNLLAAAQGGGWQQSVVELPVGNQFIHWETAGDAEEMRLDDLRVEPLPSLAVVLDPPQLPWNGPEWTTRNLAPAAAGWVAASGIVRSGESARNLWTWITGPAEVTVVSSAISEGLTAPRAVPLRLDGVLSAQIQALPDGWFRTTVLVPAGSHQLLLAAEAAPGESSVECLVDAVQVNRLLSVSVSEALDCPAAWVGTVTGAPEQAWRGLSGVSDAVAGTALGCGPLTKGSSTELTLNVTGPGEMIFSVRSEEGYNQNRFKVWLDGAVVMAPFVLTDWRHLKFMVPTGNHSVKFTARALRDGSSAPLNFWLDAVKFLPADAGVAGIAAAAGLTNGEWSRSTSLSGWGWRSHSGLPGLPSPEAAVCMGPLEVGASATMSATITGPGVLAFDWHHSAGFPRWETSLTCEVDGVEQLDFSDSSYGNFRSHKLVFAEGTRTITWKLVREGAADEPQDAMFAWVDNVSFTPAIPNGTLADALDMTGNIATDATWPFRRVPLEASPVTTSGGPVDDDAAYIELPPTAAAWIEIPVTGPGRFGCWIRVEREYQRLALEIDGIRYAEAPGLVASASWEPLEFPVAAGSHVMRILLRPLQGVGRIPPELTQKLWITGFARLPEVTLEEALDAPSLTWNAGPTPAGTLPMGWIGYPAADGLSDDAAATLGTAPLSTSVTGPAVVKFHWEAEPVLLFGYSELPPVGLESRFFLDGTLRRLLADDLEGADEEIFVGPGAHTLTWQRAVPWASRRLVLNHVQVQPVDTTALATALGVPHSVVGLSGNQTWTVETSDSHDGLASLRATGAVGRNAQLEMDIEGPGELTYWWRGDLGPATGAEATAAAFLLRFEGERFVSERDYAAVQGAVSWRQNFPWEQRRLKIGVGRFRMTWNLWQNSGPPHQLWLDEVNYTPFTLTSGMVALADALDAVGLPWTSSSGWQRVEGNLESSPTDDVLLGAVISPGNAEQWVETSIIGPTTLHFWYGTGAYHSVIPPRALIDGVASNTGIVSETPFATITVPAGTHTVRIVFPADLVASYRPLLDYVRVGTTLEQALDTIGLTWTGNMPAWTSGDAGRDDVVGTYDSSGCCFVQSVATGAEVQFDVLFVSTPLDDPRRDLGPPLLEFALDGITRWDSRGLAPGWQTIRVPLTKAQQIMHWEQSGSTEYYGGYFLLDHVVVLPGDPTAITLAEALDTPGRTWTGSWSPVINSLGSVRDDWAAAAPGYSTLSTTVTGPAWVQFDYLTGDHVFEFQEGANTQFLSEPSFAWPDWKQSPRYLIGTGNHLLSWQTQSYGNPARTVALDSVNIESLAEVPLSTALDTTINWTSTTGAGSWFGMSVPDAVGGSAAVAAFFGPHTTPGFLEATITGPAMLEYRYRSLTNAVNAYTTHSMLVDGALQPTRTLAGGAWQTMAWAIPAGIHAVKFQAFSSSLTTWGDTPVIMDRLTLTPPPSLSDALNCSALNITTTGSVAPQQYADGTREIYLGGERTTDSGIDLTVIGPGEVSLDFTHDSSYWSTSLNLWVDGLPAVGEPYRNNFSRVSQRIALGAGTHTVRWVSPSGSGIRIHRLCWEPGVPAWAQWLGGLDGGISAWVTSSSNAGWTPVAGAGPGGVEALQSSLTTSGITLQPVLNQPGTLCYWGRASQPYSYGIFGSNWRFFRDFVGVGGVAPAWVHDGNGFLQVAGVSFTPSTLVPLDVALDTPGRTWVTSNPQGWHGLTDPSAEGGSAVFTSGSPVASVIQTTITGPGWLSFSQRGPGHADLTLNDQDAPLTSKPAGDWTTFYRWLEAGTQEVKWTLRGDAGCWLDAFHFQAATSVSLAEALDTDNAVWTTSSGAPWVGLGNVNGTIGNDVAVLPRSTTGENWIQTTFSGSGELRFRWAFANDVDPSPFDEIQFLLDGEVLARRARGDSADQWEDQVFALGGGLHTLRWRYVTLIQREGAWLDQVSFTPNAVAETWGPRLGQPGLNFSGGGATLWQNRPAGGLGINSALLQREMSLVTSITGPAWVSYDQLNTDPAARVTVNGTTPPDDWLEQTPTRRRFYVPAGAQSVVWRWQKGENATGSGIPAMANLSVAPMTALTPAEAADAPDFPLSPQSGTWLGTPHDSSLQGGNLIAVYPPPTSKASMKASVTGPGVLRFWWKQAYESSGSNVFQVKMDNLPAASISGLTAWEEVTVVVPPGTHELEWISPFSAPSGPTGFIDGIAWHPTAPTTTLALAADLNGLTSLTTQSNAWFPLDDALLSWDGVDVLAANAWSSPPSLLEAECAGSGTLHFRIRNPGSIEIKLNGHPLLGSISNSLGWQEHTVFLSGPGPHHVSWRIGYFGNLPVLLDQLSFSPVTETLALAQALDQPRWIFETGGSRPWTGSPTPAGKGGSLAAVHTLGMENNLPWVQTTLTGPGLLTFIRKGAFSLKVDGNDAYADGRVTIANGPHTVRWQPSEAYYNADRSFTLDDLQWYPETWEGWLDYRFTGTGTTLAQQAPYADPDGDQRCNALEAVLGSDPLAFDPPPLDVVRGLWSAESVEPQFIVAQKYPPGLFLSLECASHLAGPWTLFGAAGVGHEWFYPLSSSPIPDQPGQVLVRPYFSTFDYEEPAKFWRLRVEKQ